MDIQSFRYRTNAPRRSTPMAIRSFYPARTISHHRTTCVRVIQLLESDLLEHDDADLRELGHIHATLMDEERRSGRLHGRPTGGLVPLTIRSQDPTNWLHHSVSIQPSSNWKGWASIWANRADEISEILRATNPADPGFIDVIGIQSFMFRLKNVCCEQDKLTKLEAILTDSSLFEPFNESTSLFGLELESLREKMLSCPTYPLRCDRELEEE